MPQQFLNQQLWAQPALRNGPAIVLVARLQGCHPFREFSKYAVGDRRYVQQEGNGLQQAITPIGIGWVTWKSKDT
jgi:hypothetical protein